MTSERIAEIRTVANYAAVYRGDLLAECLDEIERLKEALRTLKSPRLN